MAKFEYHTSLLRVRSEEAIILFYSRNTPILLSKGRVSWTGPVRLGYIVNLSDINTIDICIRGLSIPWQISCYDDDINKHFKGFATEEILNTQVIEIFKHQNWTERS